MSAMASAASKTQGYEVINTGILLFLVAYTLSQGQKVYDDNDDDDNGDEDNGADDDNGDDDNDDDDNGEDDNGDDDNGDDDNDDDDNGDDDNGDDDDDDDNGDDDNDDDDIGDDDNDDDDNGSLLSLPVYGVLLLDSSSCRVLDWRYLCPGFESWLVLSGDSARSDWAIPISKLSRHSRL